MPKFTFEVLIKANAKQLSSTLHNVVSSFRSLEKGTMQTAQAINKNLNSSMNSFRHTVNMAINQVNRQFQTLNQTVNKINQNTKKAGSGGFNGLISSVNGAKNALNGLFAIDLFRLASDIIGGIAGQVHQIAEGLIDLGKTVFDINAQWETMNLGLGAIIASFTTITDSSGHAISKQDAYNVALELSKKKMEELRNMAALNVGETEEYVKAYQYLLGAVAETTPTGKEGDVDKKLTELTQSVVAAKYTLGGALAQGIEQALRETKMLLSGRYDMKNTLAQNLGITRTEFKKWQDEGTILDNVIAKMKFFKVASEASAKSMTGLTSTLADINKLFALEFGGEAFKGIEAFLQRIVGSLIYVKDGVLTISPMIKETADVLKAMFQSTWNQATQLIDQIVFFIQNNQPMLQAIGMLLNDTFTALLGLAGDMLSYLTENKDMILTMILAVDTLVMNTRPLVKMLADMVNSMTSLVDLALRLNPLGIGSAIGKGLLTGDMSDMNPLKGFSWDSKTTQQNWLQQAQEANDAAKGKTAPDYSKGIFKPEDFDKTRTMGMESEASIAGRDRLMRMFESYFNNVKAATTPAPYASSLFTPKQENLPNPNNYNVKYNVGALSPDADRDLNRISRTQAEVEWMNFSKKMGSFADIEAGEFKTRTKTGKQEVELKFEVGDKKKTFTVDMTPQELEAFKKWVQDVEAKTAKKNFVQNSRNHNVTRPVRSF